VSTGGNTRHVFTSLTINCSLLLLFLAYFHANHVPIMKKKNSGRIIRHWRR